VDFRRCVYRRLLGPGGGDGRFHPSGGSVRHMQVVFADPGKQLRLSGGLGPLQAMGVAGSMSFVLIAQGEGTRLMYRYEVGGYTAGGLAALAGPVDQVQLGQLNRLKAYVEE